ncbi:MAG TPA: AbrB/MazE/SpoVT family DNA-binding domain-containing protein [Candidatus Acidoferrum sp.]|nr:AbrB/MazE/SpoVT family DNA-binding domain-containing protein [Candidatus Acidoferrum sp.]
MKTKLSTKGQIVLPGPIRRSLGLQPGDSLDAKLQGSGVMLTPERTRPRKAKIVIDSITGLPVLSVGPDAPLLTSSQVREILDEFP